MIELLDRPVNMLLQEIPKTTRPREKLLAMGSQTLTDAELLAVMLGTGLRGQNVLQLAQSLLDEFHGLAGLLQSSPSGLQKAKGLGAARRSKLLAVLEMARRVLLQKMQEREVLNNPDTVKQFLQLQMGAYSQEVFAVVFMDAQYRLLDFHEMFRGTLNQTSVYPREVVKLALELGAAATGDFPGRLAGVTVVALHASIALHYLNGGSGLPRAMYFREERIHHLLVDRAGGIHSN